MKRILKSSLLLFAVTVMVAGGTAAFFNDTETSSGNVFTAGSIDLLINHSNQSYNGVNCETCLVTLVSNTTDNLVVAQDGAALTSPYPAVTPDSIGPNWADPVGAAEWIWGETAMPDGNDDTTYTFENTFNWQGNPGDVMLDFQLAADDDYRIILNGTEITSGDDAWQTVSTLTLPGDELQQGANTIRFEVTNSGGFRAGLMYQLTIESEDCEAGVADFQATCELWESIDLTNESFFNFSDIKPQDEGTNRISLTVEDNEAYMCLGVANADNDENSYLDAEQAAGDTSDDIGEMGDFLQVAGWYSDATGDFDGMLFGPSAANDLESIPYADSDGGTPIQPGTTEYVELAWCLGEMTADDDGYTCDGTVPDINQTQTDAFLADLQFYAIQTRNNDDFTCSGFLGNGTTTPGEEVIGCTDEADVMLVLDSSGSVGGDLGTLQDAAKDFVDTLQVSSGGVEVGVVDFDSSSTLVQGLTGDASLAKTQIDTLTVGGQTYLDQGIATAQQELNDNGRAGVPKCMLIVSDGDANNESAAATEAASARGDGVTIFAVGVGSNIDPTFLEDDIVTQPANEHYFAASNFEALQDELDEILECAVPQ